MLLKEATLNNFTVRLKFESKGCGDFDVFKLIRRFQNV
jgi:hypothetical protein